MSTFPSQLLSYRQLSTSAILKRWPLHGLKTTKPIHPKPNLAYASTVPRRWPYHGFKILKPPSPIKPQSPTKEQTWAFLSPDQSRAFILALAGPKPNPKAS